MSTENGWMKHVGGRGKRRTMVCVVDLRLGGCRGMNVEQE